MVTSVFLKNLVKWCKTIMVTMLKNAQKYMLSLMG